MGAGVSSWEDSLASVERRVAQKTTGRTLAGRRTPRCYRDSLAPSTLPAYNRRRMARKWRAGASVLVLVASAFLFVAIALETATPPDERPLLTAAASDADLDARVAEKPDLARRVVERLVTSALAAKAAGRDAGDLLQAVRIAAAIEARFSDPAPSRRVAHANDMSVETARAERAVDERLRRAQALYDRAEFVNSATEAADVGELYRQLGERGGELRAKNLRGNSLWASGNVSGARAVFEDLKRLASEREDFERLASAMGNLASLDLEEGHYREAAAAYRGMEALARAHGLLRPRAFAALYLGNIYHQLGLPDKATAFFESAERDFHRLGDPALEAAAVLNRGASLQRRGQRSEALRAYRRALLLHTEQGNRRGRAFSLLNVAELLAESGDVDRAADALGELLRILPGGHGTETAHLRWGALVTSGDLARDRGALAVADRSYAEALSIALTLERPLDTAETRWRQAEILERRGQSARALEELEAAVEILERLRARPASEDERVRLVDSRRRLYEDLANAHFTRFRNPAAAFSVLERFRSRAFLDLLGGPAQVDWSEREGARVVLESRPSRPAILETLTAALPEGALLLHYTAASDWFGLMAFDREGLQFWRVRDVRAQEIETKGARFIEAVSHPEVPYDSGGEELSALLLGDVERLVRRHRFLYVVPDGALFALPWAALRWGPEGRRLGESHVVAIEPSASVLVKWLSARAPSRRPSDPLIVSGPALEEGRAEASSIASLFSGSKVLSGASATEAELGRHMENRSLVHFATHAHIDAGRPLASALLLTATPDALENTRLAPLDPSDGVLTGYEVLNGSLAPGALVTLAACQTAGRPGAGSEGVAGLARAFFQAGASSVVASLWPVEDRATRELMLRFYRRLAAGQPRGEALSGAQAELSRGEAGERLAHPYYWAGFALIGDPR